MKLPDQFPDGFHKRLLDVHQSVEGAFATQFAAGGWVNRPVVDVQVPLGERMGGGFHTSGLRRIVCVGPGFISVLCILNINVVQVSLFCIVNCKQIGIFHLWMHLKPYHAKTRKLLLTPYMRCLPAKCFAFSLFFTAQPSISQLLVRTCDPKR